MKKILVSSAISTALVILALLVVSYLIAIETSVGPEGMWDNGPVHGFGSLLYASPFLFLFLTVTTFSVSVLARSLIRWLKTLKGNA